MTTRTSRCARTWRRSSPIVGAALAAALAVGTAGPALATGGVPTTASAPTAASVRRHDAGTWTSLPPIAEGPRQEHSVVSIGRDVYVIGGTVLDPSAPFGVSTSGRVEVYDTRRGTWSTAAPLPVAMNHLNAAAVDGKIYVLGGLSGGATWEGMPNSYVYDPRTDAWTPLAPAPAHTWRGSAVMGTEGTTVYLAGGLRTLELVPNGLQDSVSTVTSYDTATGRWTRLPNLPQPRDHAGGALVHGTLYVIGGRDHGQANVRGTVYAFGLRSRRWSERAAMPTRRGGIAAAAVGDSVYTFGGEGNPAAGSQGVYPETEAYDTVRDTWRSLTPMPVPVHGTGAAAVQGTIYLPGGGITQSSGPAAVNQSYRPRGRRHG